jgi:small subunit ribosomal protein S17
MVDETKTEAAEAPAAPGRKRKMRGIVRSNKMDKTVVVEVSRRSMNGKYRKYVKSRERYKAHDAENTYNIGDTVEIEATRPLSRGKRWTVIRLVTAAK